MELQIYIYYYNYTYIYILNNKWNCIPKDIPQCTLSNTAPCRHSKFHARNRLAARRLTTLDPKSIVLWPA